MSDLQSEANKGIYRIPPIVWAFKIVLYGGVGIYTIYNPWVRPYIYLGAGTILALGFMWFAALVFRAWRRGQLGQSAK
jgi:hypothetical protein